jgi:hypothetical protein
MKISNNKIFVVSTQIVILFSNIPIPGTLVSSTNKTDCHDITEILLKVVLNTITPNHGLNYISTF